MLTHAPVSQCAQKELSHNQTRTPKLKCLPPRLLPNHPELFLIPAIDFVTRWGKCWLTLESHCPLVWPMTSPVAPRRPSQWSPKSRRDFHGVTKASQRPKIAKGLHNGSPRQFRYEFGNKFATIATRNQFTIDTQLQKTIQNSFDGLHRRQTAKPFDKH